MKVIPFIRPPDKVERFDFPPGYAMTVGTLRIMCDLVKKWHEDPRIRTRAQQIFSAYTTESGDHDAEIAAVYDFCLRNIRYQKDPLGAEHITDPLRLDEQIDQGVASEDCESIATYAATLLAASGIRSDFDIHGPNPGRFTHCALLVENPYTKRWTAFDPVGEHYLGPERFTLGSRVDLGARERWSLEGERREGELVGLGDAASNLAEAKKYTGPISDILTMTAPIPIVGPIASLVGLGLKAGTGIATAIVGDPKPVPPSVPAGALLAGGVRLSGAMRAPAQKKTSPFLWAGLGLLAVKLLGVL